MQKVTVMLTREQILEIDTYCVEHQVSQQRYLDEHDIPRHQYYVWKRKYRQEDEQSAEPGACAPPHKGKEGPAGDKLLRSNDAGYGGRGRRKRSDRSPPVVPFLLPIPSVPAP